MTDPGQQQQLCTAQCSCQLGRVRVLPAASVLVAC